MKIEERCILKHNDLIGLGCKEDALNGPEEDLSVKREDMYVYRLVDVTKNRAPIEISDDDDDIHVDKDIKPVISNGIVKEEPVQKPNDANRMPPPRQNAGMLVFYIFSLKKI